ncbi:MAG: NAD(P)/FAD-dependent oxidoreductase [Nitrososphaerota archaeon]
MRIAVVGVGVAGSYLLSRLRDQYRVDGYEMLARSRYFPICAWGTSRNMMKNFANKVGLNFEEYILHTGKELIVDLGRELHHIKLRGLCTFDKKRFEEDLLEDCEVRFGSRITSMPDGYDLVIDSTGFNRSLLPKVKNDYFIPTVEYRVKFSNPPFDDFYIKPFRELSGYLWYFPLGGNLYHVGAGDYFKRHSRTVDEFVKKYGGEVLMKIGRPVRITPPLYCQPIYMEKIVGVGESIGTVFPMLGEGIIPSLYSAEALVENLYNIERYRKTILRMFKPFSTVFEFIHRALTRNIDLKRDWFILFKIYLHMRFREERYGVQARIRDFLKVVGAARQSNIMFCEKRSSVEV